jgi:hypothetical protein
VFAGADHAAARLVDEELLHAQARAERPEAGDVLDVVHLLVDLVLVFELHPVRLVVEGDVLADVEQAPVAACRTVQLHPQAAWTCVVIAPKVCRHSTSAVTPMRSLS